MTSLERGEEVLDYALEELFRGPPAARAGAYDALRARVDHADPGSGALFALGAGALVEAGLDAEPLALAVLRPLSRALGRARPFKLAAEALPADARGVPVGARCVDEGALDELADDMPDAHRAYESLAIWYRPVAAAWARCLPVLRAVQADAAFLELLAPFADDAMTWIDCLTKVLFDAPFVAWFPELDRAYTFRLSGCADMGQLTVLLADAVPEPLRAIGAENPLPPGVAQVMRGEGPQAIADAYESDFHIYPWQSLREDTLMPEDGIYTWVAPGGSGDISLVADFFPADVTPSDDGVRVIAVVGLGEEGVSSFTRSIGGTRAFSGLAARLDGMRQLSEAELGALKGSLRVVLADGER